MEDYRIKIGCNSPKEDYGEIDIGIFDLIKEAFRYRDDWYDAGVECDAISSMTPDELAYRFLKDTVIKYKRHERKRKDSGQSSV